MAKQERKGSRKIRLWLFNESEKEDIKGLFKDHALYFVSETISGTGQGDEDYFEFYVVKKDLEKAIDLVCGHFDVTLPERFYGQCESCGFEVKGEFYCSECGLRVSEEDISSIENHLFLLCLAELGLVPEKDRRVKDIKKQIKLRFLQFPTIEKIAVVIVILVFLIYYAVKAFSGNIRRWFFF